MLQFIVQFLPLIFLCAAFGVVILNFDSVAAYIVYVISMLIQPKELIHATNELAAVPRPPQSEKKKFSIFRPFVRIWTLFFVLFFPSIDVEKITGKKSKKSTLPQVNVYEEKTLEEVNKYHIKTYSVPSTENLKNFRSAFEPAAPLSSPFTQAFPDVVNILHKINKIEDPEVVRPKPPIGENNISDTLPEFKAYDSKSQLTVGNTDETPHILSSKVMPSENEVAEEKFDAIAALEKKVSALKSDNPKSVAGKVEYADAINKSSQINNGKNFTVDIPKPETLPKIPLQVSNVKSEDTHSINRSIDFSGATSIFSLLGKIIVYTLLSLPILIAVGSVVYFLVLNRFNLTQLVNYPSWVSTNLESFVKIYILKQ